MWHPSCCPFNDLFTFHWGPNLNIHFRLMIADHFILYLTQLIVRYELGAVRLPRKYSDHPQVEGKRENWLSDHLKSVEAGFCLFHAHTTVHLSHPAWETERSDCGMWVWHHIKYRCTTDIPFGSVALHSQVMTVWDRLCLAQMIGPFAFGTWRRDKQ